MHPITAQACAWAVCSLVQYSSRLLGSQEAGRSSTLSEIVLIGTVTRIQVFEEVRLLNRPPPTFHNTSGFFYSSPPPLSNLLYDAFTEIA